MEEGIILELLNLGVAGVLLILLIRGDLVPRSVLNREITRGDKATEAASANSTALTVVTETMKEQRADIKEFRTEMQSAVNDVRDRINRLHPDEGRK